MKLSKKNLQELKDKKISVEELNDRYFINSKNEVEEVHKENIKKLLDNDICNFKEIVDKYKIVKLNYDVRHYSSGLGNLLKNIDELRFSEKLSQDDLRYLLNKIDDYTELQFLVRAQVIEKILNKALLVDKGIVENLNSVIDEHYYWVKNKYDIFDWIEDENKINKELLKLNDLNRYTYMFKFNKNQKAELYNILKNSESSRNTLKQIVDSSLHDTYDFETLKELLTKDEEKKKIKINL